MTRNVIVLGAAHPHVLSLAQAAATSNQLRLIGLYDEDPTVRQKAADHLDVPKFDHLDVALRAEPSLALIGAIPRLRTALAEHAVAAGAAVLCDKPIALNLAQLTRLQDAQRQYGKPIITYHPYRGTPKIRAARDAFAAGKIGQLVRVFASGPHQLHPVMRPPWHWTQSDNGGLIIDIGTHAIDLCCWLAGCDPVWINARHGNWSQPDHCQFQDFAMIQMRFASGVLANVEADWLASESLKTFGDGRLWIQGTAGKIEVYQGDEPHARIWTDQSAGKDLDTSIYPTVDQWTRRLIENLATDHLGDMNQNDIWRTIRTVLCAFDSAEASGQPWQANRTET